MAKRFNNYAHFLTYLKEDEQDLVLDLTGRFIDIPLSNYFAIVVNIIKTIVKNNADIKHIMLHLFLKRTI